MKVKMLERLQILFLALALASGIGFAQGPKKDIGVNVPLPPEVPDDKASNPAPKLELPKASTIALDVDLVNLDVTVTDNEGNPVHDLTKDQFKVFDDNVEQQITHFSVSSNPVTVALMMEFGATINFRRLLPVVADLIGLLQPQDWAALVTFNRTPDIVRDFTRDKNQLVNALGSLVMPRYPDIRLNDAVWEMVDKMEGIDGKKAIVLVGTGMDTGDFTNHSYLDTLKKTEASSAPIYAISMSHVGGVVTMRGNVVTAPAQADNNLMSFAENSGGHAFFPQYPQQVPEAYEKLQSEMRYAYSLGYTPTNRSPDGKFHKLRVEVTPGGTDRKGKPTKLKAQHKQGYYARKS